MTAGVETGCPLPPPCILGAYLNVKLITKQEELWAPAGYAAAQAQLPVPCERKAFPELLPDGRKLYLQETERQYILRGEDFEYRFDRTAGSITGLAFRGEELLAQPVSIGIYRAPTDNDRNVRWQWYSYGETRYPGEHPQNYNLLEHKVYDLSAEPLSGGSVRIRVRAALCPVALYPLVRYDAQYTFRPNGEIDVGFAGTLRDGALYLPRLGYEFVLSAGMENVTYFGRGPLENYQDTKLHAPVGLYHTTVTDEYVPYPKPQEHGNHTDVRMISVSSERGSGLTVRSGGTFETAVSHFAARDLEAAGHSAFLKPREQTFLRIDYRDSGIGSGSCMVELQEKYRLQEKHMKYSFTLLPSDVMTLTPEQRISAVPADAAQEGRSNAGYL